MTVDDPLRVWFSDCKVTDIIPIGSGGTARVYRGVTRTGRQVAIKVLKPQFENGAGAQSLRRESDVHAKISTLGHPNLLRYVASGPTHIVTDLLDGDDLTTHVERGTVFPLLHVLDISLQICSGLDAIHRLGLVHRDLKPDNLFLIKTPKGWLVKILDFGITVPFKDSGASPEGTVCGTPSYMPFEQCRGDVLDARADLYALGCIMYFLLTQEVLNPALNPVEAAEGMKYNEERIVQHRLLEQVPMKLRSLLLSLVSCDPARRPASAQATAATIQQIIDELTRDSAEGTLEQSKLSCATSPSYFRWQMLSAFLASVVCTSTLLLIGYRFLAPPPDAMTPRATGTPSPSEPVRMRPQPADADAPTIDIRPESPLAPAQCWSPRGAARHFAFVRIGDVKAAADARCWDQIPVQRRQRQCSHLRRRHYESNPHFGRYCHGF